MTEHKPLTPSESSVVIPILRGLFSRDRWLNSAVLILSILVLGALAGAVFGILVAIGQIIAIGFRATWAVYAKLWLVAPMFGAIALLVLLLATALSEAIDSVSKSPAAEHATKFLFSGLLVGGVSMFIYLGYQTAERDNAILSSPSTKSPAAIAGSLDSQQVQLGQLSSDTRRLLVELDQSLENLRNARSELALELLAVDTQLAATAEVTRRVRSLRSRQQQIELRNQELARILGGYEPITLEDLDASGRKGLLYGTILGFLGNIAAAWVLRRFSRSRAMRSIDSRTRAGP